MELVYTIDEVLIENTLSAKKDGYNRIVVD